MSTDDERLRAESLEIETLLGEIQSLVPAPAWQRVEGVLSRLSRLYGAGLARVLAHARAAGVAPRFDDLVCDDDLVASLLVLHGLHPRSVEQRVQKAIALARSELGLADEELVIVRVEGGRVELQTNQPLGGGAMASRVAEGAIRRVIESVAPEVMDVQFQSTVPTRDPSLVQLRVRREGP
jgi:hypothetical protein